MYSVDVRNRFEALQVTGNDDNNADTTYNNIIAAHNKAAKIYIPKKEKKKHHIAMVKWEHPNKTTSSRRSAEGYDKTEN